MFLEHRLSRAYRITTSQRGRITLPQRSARFEIAAVLALKNNVI
jgi:hypothetical protein